MKDEEIKKKLKEDILRKLIDAAKDSQNKEQKALVYLTDIGDIDAFYFERLNILESLKKEGVVLEFEEAEKWDELVEWTDLEIEQDPEGWFEYKQNFKPEERIFAEVSFNQEKVIDYCNKLGILRSAPGDYRIVFNPEKSILTIKNIPIKIRKFSEQYHLLRIIFEKDLDITNECFFSEIAEIYDNKAGNRLPDKKFYNAVYQINQKIIKKARIENYFLTTNQSFRINPEYIRKN